MKQRGIALVFTLIVLAVMSALTVTSVHHLRLQRTVETSVVLRQQAEQVNQNILAQVKAQIMSAMQTQPNELPFLLAQTLAFPKDSDFLSPSHLCLGGSDINPVSTDGARRQFGSITWLSWVGIASKEVDDCELEQEVSNMPDNSHTECLMFVLTACTEQLAGRLVVGTSQQLTLNRRFTDCSQLEVCASRELEQTDYVEVVWGNWRREVSYAAAQIQL